MTFIIKICGVMTPEAVAAASDAGATEVGLVFAESKRRVTVEVAAELAALAPPLRRVAVFRHPRPGEVAGVLARVDIDCVQSDAVDEPSIRTELGGVPFRPVFRDGPDLAEQFARRVPGAEALVEGPQSGTGTTPDWARIAALVGGRFVLAGGLSPENVGAAIRIVRPAGVDVSSGVESAPGQKDPAQVRAFVQAARAAFEKLRGGAA